MSVTLSNSTNDYDWRKRPATDFYPTPSDVTRALVDFLKLDRSTRIWECASGEGHMSKELQSCGYQVFETDIKQGVDFRVQESAFGANWIITNPPFIIADEFICKAASLPIDGFALLLKSQYWHATTRFELFNRIKPSFVLPLTWRPDFLFGAKSSAPTMEVFWCVWFSPYNQETKYQPLKKPLIRKEVRQ